MDATKLFGLITLSMLAGVGAYFLAVSFGFVRFVATV